MKRLYYTFPALAVGFFGFSAVPVLAQDGYVGLGLGSYGTTNPDYGDHDGTSVALDGAYSWSVGTSGKVVLEGSHRSDNISSSALPASEMTTQSHLAVHYLQSLQNAMTLGGFVGYGVAPHDSSDEDYSVVYGGIEAMYPVSDKVLLFGQLGAGDAPRADETDSRGFEQATFLRVGAVFSPWERTALTLDLEAATSNAYEDPDEPGDFGSLYFGGQTVLGDDRYMITYGVRHAWFDALNDANKVEETTVSLGIRFVFGGGKPGSLERNGIIGSPYLPLRASNWVPALD